jgi:acyl-CoA thioester hydrolase
MTRSRLWSIDEPRNAGTRAVGVTPLGRLRIPERGPRSRVEYRVPFYDTDAMGVVHHANYVRYLELARVRFLQEHDQPYTRYVESGIHVVVTRVELLLRRATRFDETLAVEGWLSRVRNASFSFAYQIRCGEEQTALASTDHAVVDLDGKLQRMTAAHRARLLSLVAG